MAIWLYENLKDAKAQAANLWRNRIGPWLRSAWPKEPGLRGPSASLNLALAATMAGEAFADAACCVSELIEPIEDAGIILEPLRENQLIAEAPDACLALMNALTPDEPPSWFGDLRDFLNEVRAAQPELANDRRFRRLDQIAFRRAL